MLRPPPVLAVTVQSKFHGEGMIDYPQMQASNGVCLTAFAKINSMLLKALNGSSLKTRQQAPAKSKQFIWDISIM